MLNYIAAGFSNMGVSANAMTFAGFVLSFAAAWTIAGGRLMLASALVIASGLCDLFDGKIARLRGTAGKFGALLDSSLDRYSDALYYIAIAAYFWRADKPEFALLAFAACTGAFAISYVRARSEGLGQKCSVGFWERGERTVFIIAALFTHNLEWCVLLLGVATHFTALRRLLHARRQLALGEAAASEPAAPPKNFRSPAWWAPRAILLLSLLIVRL